MKIGIIKHFLAACFLLVPATGIHAQEQGTKTYLPKFAIKTNALYWTTSTPNLGFEVALTKKLTPDVSGNYNPWKFSKDRQTKHWLIQPEFHYWLCGRFSGSLFGLHGRYANVNMSNLDIFGLGNYHYDDKIYGAGISYGYHWILKNRWNMEATIGAGYTRLNYNKYAYGKCDEKLGHNSKSYFGPTRIGLNIIYTIK